MRSMGSRTIMVSSIAVGVLALLFTACGCGDSSDGVIRPLARPAGGAAVQHHHGGGSAPTATAGGTSAPAPDQTK